MSEAQAKQDLAIKHYAATWRDAKRLAKALVGTAEYWGAVRNYYLELGGLYVRQLPVKKQALYFSGAPTV